MVTLHAFLQLIEQDRVHAVSLILLQHPSSLQTHRRALQVHLGILLHLIVDHAQALSYQAQLLRMIRSKEHVQYHEASYQALSRYVTVMILKTIYAQLDLPVLYDPYGHDAL